jgi:hypothetical protein
MINDEPTKALNDFNLAISDKVDSLLINKKQEVLDTYFNQKNTEGEE